MPAIDTDCWRGWRDADPVLRFANFWVGRPGEGFGPRYVQEHQIVYVRSGRGRAVIGGQTFSADPGDLLYWPPNRRHEVQAIGSAPLRLVGIVLLFHADDERRLPEPEGHQGTGPFRFARGKPGCPLRPYPLPHTPTPPQSPVRRWCEALVFSFLMGRRTRAMEQRGLLLALFQAWHDALHRRPSHGPPLEAAAPPHDDLRQVLQTIERRLAQPPAIAELAEEIGVTTAYFGRLFKRHTGQSVRAYINRRRLLRARDLLLARPVSVQYAARAVGFDDPLYFSRLFARQFGLPPSALRQTQHEI
jgi:AraC-like DNA-binding protein